MKPHSVTNKLVLLLLVQQTSMGIFKKKEMTSKGVAEFSYGVLFVYQYLF